ncbi:MULTISPECIES: cysteine desulfurase family protein [Gemella]|uniref:cysteine desulfurase family protein n=1 Tax=Gemella TaxID=1378 RepID=UPI000767F4D9|nr:MULTISPECIES: cysteine desulfurase family protein [Gemella]AME09721.1 cysteine desulfurase [Gemella sp. oral taxon 928]AXI27323.1 cysteine desulfurase [Gemella sp. ND 6198]
MENIYLDYAATSKKHFDIIEKNLKLLKEIYANPSSSHTLGKKNAKLKKEAQQKIAYSINAQPEEIIFTSGGTESNNTVFNHVFNRFKSGEIIISEIEHPSVKASARHLEHFGFTVIELAVGKNGMVSLEELEDKITDNTVLISIMFANNETGVLNPIKEISKLISGKNILLHSDIVQAFAKIEIDVKDLGVDFASVSAHKIGALNNFGFLYAKNGIVEPFILGGGQENGLRSGTSDVLGALTLADSIDETLKTVPYLRDLKNYFIEKLEKNNVEFEVNGAIEYSLPNILNIYFKNIESQRLITYLDANEVYISGGSACSSGNIKGSKIITQMYNIERAAHSVRISVGFDVDKKMIDNVINKIVYLEQKIKERNK